MTHNCTNTRLQGKTSPLGGSRWGVCSPKTQPSHEKSSTQEIRSPHNSCMFVQVSGHVPGDTSKNHVLVKEDVYVVQGQGVTPEGWGKRWKNWDERIRGEEEGMLLLPKNTQRDYKAAQWIWTNRFLILIRLYLHFWFPRLKVYESFECLK